MKKQEIEKLIAKISELGLLQAVDRRITRAGGDRPESTAEHSWHLAMMAWLLLPYYEQKLNVEKVLKLALVHDVVEIYAGDTFAFDNEHKKTKHAREDAAADKLFDKKDEMYKLWREYALRQSPEALYVAAIDKLVPMVRHQERSDIRPEWQGSLTESELRQYKQPQLKHSQFLMELFEELTHRIREKGFFSKK